MFGDSNGQIKFRAKQKYEVLSATEDRCLFVCLFGFYGISSFLGYLMPNPFLYK